MTQENSDKKGDKVKILAKRFVTHDVKSFIVEKPKDYKFTPGQATDVSINLPGWEKEKRPFTFTSLNNDNVLEFTIKGYYDHNGVTKKLHGLNSGDELIIQKPWGAISYKGKGVFIAAGAGITPFIAILRDLQKKGELKGNKLIFSNKRQEDIILEKELKNMFKDNPKNLVLTLTDEKINNEEKYENKIIDKEFLQKYIKDFKNQHFYICGPPKFVEDISNALKSLGANPEEVVFEG